MKPLLFSVFFVAARDAQAPDAPRVGPVPESSWTDEQRATAAQFASSGMTNAIAAYLHSPTLRDATRDSPIASATPCAGRAQDDAAPAGSIHSRCIARLRRCSRAIDRRR